MSLISFCLALVLPCCLLSSQTLAGKTTRRFFGIPDFDGRVNNVSNESSKTLIVRHNLPGRVWLHESSAFWVEFQLTTPEGHNNSDVKTLYKLIENDTILLQVYTPSLPPPVETSSKQNIVLIISASVGSFVFLCLVVSSLCYFCYWRKRHAGKTAIEKPQGKFWDGKTMSSKRRFYEAGGSGGTSRIVLTVGMVLAVCACVLQAQLPSPSVEVSVFFPRGFLRQDSKVFLNVENNNEVGVITNDTDLQIKVFDVKNASLVDENRCTDRNLTCINGACDSLTGKCTCPRKMKLDKQKGQCVYRCEDRCSTGFYEFLSCNRTHLAVCKKCRPLCSFKEFETVPCAGRTDRNCTDISKLPQIKVSPNIAYEDRLKAAEDPSVTRTIYNLSDSRTIWFNRSTGLGIQVHVLHVDFSSTFVEVNHTANDNGRLPNGNVPLAVLNDLCSFPVPDFYRLGLQESSDTFRIRKGSSGSPCPRYDGTSNVVPQVDRVLTCNGAENPVVRLFGIKNKTESFFQEERTARCHSLKQGCNGCREKCTELARSTPICNLTQDDSDKRKQDYGEHFTYCFDCCFQENCTCAQCDCFLYENSCLNSQIPCVEVKQFKVSIDPIFQEKDSFKCHVALRRRPSFQLEATIWKDGKMLTGVDMREVNRSNEARARLTRDYGFLTLRIPSVLISGSSKKDVLIRGKVGRSNFDVGWYKAMAEEVSTSETNTLSVQAVAPFTINSEDWPKKECQTLNTEPFVEAPASSSVSVFEKFRDLEAELGRENQIRVFKVYNKTGSRQVQFKVPNDRSILRYVFQEAVIYNDRSFSGRLLKNRTFWTIRLSGQVSACPGSFSVRLTDQDQPDVDVYRYDIAITNEDCNFVVEFHLPSGGDTNLIDKQFVVRLTDARKTVKLILVSPRGLPDLTIPELDDEFDAKRLEILIPFGGAAGGMFLLLIALLIFGYKTRPRDKYHRDRDNSLHFRHILFVVWFVGMRLIKSFLLTLTVFSVILVAIHYKNVSTLQQYKEFHEQQTKVEDDYIKLMDTHKTQEINRQLMIMEEGKVICDRKLKELNSFLERHFREMKERQEEEMRRKSIVRAAVHRIMKQFNETKAKFEIERKRLNKAMAAYAEEINSRISKIESKVKNSFWLKAARILYKILDALASIFGSGIGKPFINWVGLNVQFPKINIDLNPFDDIFSEFEQDSLFSVSDDNARNESIWERHFQKDLKINVQQISFPDVNVSSPLSKEKAEELLALEWIIQLYNSGVFATILVVLDILWFVYRHSKSYQLAVVLLHGFPKIYQLEKIQQREEKEEKKKKKKEDKLRKKKEQEATEEGKHRKNRKADNDSEGSDDRTMENNGSFEEKVSDNGIEDPTERRKEKNTRKRGDEANTKNSDSLETTEKKEAVSEKIKTHGLKSVDRINSAVLKVFVKLKQLNYQINNTNLVPMCVLVVIGILSVYVVIVTAKHSMNVDTLELLGFFDLKMAPLLTMRKIVNTRITSNAFMVNDVRIPYYENRVNARIELYRKRAKVYQAYQCAKADLHNEEYCSWAAELGESCEGVGPYNDDFLNNLTQFECHLDPVYPQRFTKFDRIGYKEVYKRALSPYVAALRGLILDTFYMILIVIGIFIIIKIFGIVVFLLMKKLDLVRQVKHYQTNQDLLKEASLPHCMKYNLRESAKPIRSVAVSQEIRDKCGPLINDGYHTVWR